MNSKKFLTRGQELGIMMASRVRVVASHSTLSKKEMNSKKVLDKMFKFEYNELIKNRLWEPAHQP